MYSYVYDIEHCHDLQARAASVIANNSCRPLQFHTTLPTIGQHGNVGAHAFMNEPKWVLCPMFQSIIAPHQPNIVFHFFFSDGL